MAGILTFKEKEHDVLRFHSQEHESLFHSLSRYPDNNTTALHLKYIQDNSASYSIFVSQWKIFKYFPVNLNSTDVHG